ncbi:MAG: XTP/dITP diphosphatase [Deltaproteobacteria bacterium]|nr:MAG: XTP/dITP diphosphatase [Deltaproteobacteria bacterium]
MIKLLVATTNPGKFAEVKDFLRQLPLEVLSLSDLATWPKIIEDGATFEENALKKARSLAEYSGYLTLADDSGLEVDALNGAPGIYSARYCGEEGNDKKNNEKLMHELREISEEKRTGRFVCALALCAPKSHGMKEWTVRDSCEGRISFELKGENGFGYDPLFFYPSLGKTFGEIDRAIKATVSHRGKALKKLAEMLPSLVDLNAKP